MFPIDDRGMVQLLMSALACFTLGAVGAVACARSPRNARRLGHLLALMGSVCNLGLSIGGLMGARLEVWVRDLLPIHGFSLGMDRISAVFLLLIAVGGLTASVYGLAYSREYEGKLSLASYGFAYNGFLAAMTLVVLARNSLTFLILWEAMSLASYFLVMTESDSKETQRTGWIYLVMTHAGFACLLIGFLLMTQAMGTMDFALWHARSSSWQGLGRHAVFVLLALGFGSKAGVIPLHIWLPRAHPAAPSPISALMSGVMIKLGVYGLLRVGFDWLGVGPAAWGGAIVLFAALSSVLGVLYAMVESDLKRLLAYSSVENIGLILLGVGAGMLFQAYRLPALAALALVAALFHTFNHMLFKSLLFMGAGAVWQSTHTRNMEALGGLIKRLPQSAVYFLIGSVAIAALPPFNGFISEWLLFQSLLLSFQISVPATNLIFTAAVAAVALTSGVAAACFIKAFGISFLALPRSEEAAGAREVRLGMRAAMLVLAVACFVFGVAPFSMLSVLNTAVEGMTGAHVPLRSGWSMLVTGDFFATVSPAWIAFTLIVLVIAVALGLRWLRANPRRRLYETWSCGRALQTARFEYTASAFSNPFKRVFELLYRPVKELDIEFHQESRFFVRRIAYRNEVRSIFEDALYAPLTRWLRSFGQRVKVLQSGNVHVYVLYILIALIVLLIAAH